MTTPEGNKLIAGFMGIRDENIHVTDLTVNPAYKAIEPAYKIEGERMAGRATELKYHSSWDWIMPVWQKLRQEVWFSFNESYPKEFMLYVENWKTSCFNNSIGDARNAVLDGIDGTINNLIPKPKL